MYTPWHLYRGQRAHSVWTLYGLQSSGREEEKIGRCLGSDKQWTNEMTITHDLNWINKNRGGGWNQSWVNEQPDVMNRRWEMTQNETSPVRLACLIRCFGTEVYFSELMMGHFSSQTATGPRWGHGCMCCKQPNKILNTGVKTVKDQKLLGQNKHISHWHGIKAQVTQWKSDSWCTDVNGHSRFSLCLNMVSSMTCWRGNILTWHRWKWPPHHQRWHLRVILKLQDVSKCAQGQSVLGGYFTISSSLTAISGHPLRLTYSNEL